MAEKSIYDRIIMLFNYEKENGLESNVSVSIKHE